MTVPVRALAKVGVTLYLLSTEGLLLSVPLDNDRVWSDPTPVDLDSTLLDCMEVFIDLTGDEHGVALLTESGTLWLLRANRWTMIATEVDRFKYRYGLLMYLKQHRLHLEGRNPEGRVLDHNGAKIWELMSPVVDFDFGIYHRIYLDVHGRAYGFGSALNGEFIGCTQTFLGTPSRLPIPERIKSVSCGPTSSLLLTEGGRMLCSIPGLNYNELNADSISISSTSVMVIINNIKT